MMRILIVVFCALALFFYFRPLALTGLPTFADVGSTVSNLQAALPWPGKAAEEALIAERSRSAVLDTEIAALHAKLAGAESDALSRDQTLQSLRSVSQRNADDTQRERSRADTLAAQMVDARRNAASQVTAMKQQLDDQTLRAAGLARDNGVLHDELAQATSEAAALRSAQQASQSESGASAQTFREEHERAETLVAQMASLREDAASRIAALEKQRDDERKRFDSEIAAAGRLAQNAPTDVAGVSNGEPDRFALPDQVQIRVVVRYDRGSEAARARAVGLSRTLQARGVRIVELGAAQQPIAADSLNYFYIDDRSSAAGVADILPEFRSSLRQSKTGNTVPRPGVIEIEVAA